MRDDKSHNPEKTSNTPEKSNIEIPQKRSLKDLVDKLEEWYLKECNSSESEKPDKEPKEEPQEAAKDNPVKKSKGKSKKKSAKKPHWAKNSDEEDFEQGLCLPDNDIRSENQPFAEMLGKEILLTMKARQLNILGQNFRPIFCGTVVDVTNGFLTLDPVIIKISNAPFPTRLSFPLQW